MNTPLSDFLEKYSKENKVRFHMPGHKGKNLTGSEKFDLTEVDGADVLYSADGVIKESMDNATALFVQLKLSTVLRGHRCQSELWSIL